MVYPPAFSTHGEVSSSLRQRKFSLILPGEAFIFLCGAVLSVSTVALTCVGGIGLCFAVLYGVDDVFGGRDWWFQ